MSRLSCLDTRYHPRTCACIFVTWPYSGERRTLEGHAHWVNHIALSTDHVMRNAPPNAKEKALTPKQRSQSHHMSMSWITTHDSLNYFETIRIAAFVFSYHLYLSLFAYVCICVYIYIYAHTHTCAYNTSTHDYGCCC